MIHAHNLGAGEVRQFLDVGYISEAALGVGVGRGRGETKGPALCPTTQLVRRLRGLCDQRPVIFLRGLYESIFRGSPALKAATKLPSSWCNATMSESDSSR